MTPSRNCQEPPKTKHGTQRVNTNCSTASVTTMTEWTSDANEALKISLGEQCWNNVVTRTLTKWYLWFKCDPQKTNKLLPTVNRTRTSIPVSHIQCAPMAETLCPFGCIDCGHRYLAKTRKSTDTKTLSLMSVSSPFVRFLQLNFPLFFPVSDIYLPSISSSLLLDLLCSISLWTIQQNWALLRLSTT